MTRIRRSVLRVETVAVDFANLVALPGDAAGSLRSWSELVDFLELREALTREEAAELRVLGEGDAHRCAAALEEARRLGETVRSILGALAERRTPKAEWIVQVNRALAWGAGAPRLLRREAGWRLGFQPGVSDPLRALAPIARAVAELVASGRAAEIRRCANPRCVRYFRDRSRGRRRRWCSMAVCGNRMKVATHARRHRRRRSA
jgi:predicted RNA-binding Zn ribbon-like protein